MKSCFTSRQIVGGLVTFCCVALGEASALAKATQYCQTASICCFVCFSVCSASIVVFYMVDKKLKAGDEDDEWSEFDAKLNEVAANVTIVTTVTTTLTITVANSLAIANEQFVRSFPLTPSFSSTAFGALGVVDLAVGITHTVRFKGGFQDGTYGYLLPRVLLAYMGKVVRFKLDTLDQGEVLSLTSTDPELQASQRGFQDGTFGYLVPHYGVGTNCGDGLCGYHKVARFRLSTFDQVQVLDLTITDPFLRGFAGGFQDGTFGYLVPNYFQDWSGATGAAAVDVFSGKVPRFRLNTFDQVEVLDLTITDSDLKGFSDGFQDGTYGYLVPRRNGKVTRFRLGDFSNVEVLDLTITDATLTGFISGFEDGTYGYAIDATSYSGKVTRFRLDSFDQPEVLDLALAPPFQGFDDSFALGPYGYLVSYVPLGLDSATTNTDFGKLTRFRLSTFDQDQKEVLDLATTDADLKGFEGGFTNGPYGYLVPALNSKVVRLELGA